MTRQVKYIGREPNAIKHIKISSITSVTKEMQVKTVRYHFTLIKTDKHFKVVIPRIYEDGGNRSSHMCWWEGKLV